MNGFPALALRRPSLLCTALLAGFATVSPLAHAEDRAVSLFVGMVNGASDDVRSGEGMGPRLLESYLRLPDPWGPAAARVLESRGHIDALRDALARYQGDERRSLERSLATLARAQAGVADPVFEPIAAGQQELVLSGSANQTRWFDIEVPASGSRQILLRSGACTPSITAFDAERGLPADPASVVARYSADTASILQNGHLHLRVQAGTCGEDPVRLELLWGQPGPRLVAVPGAFPLAPVGAATVVDLQKRSSVPFAIQTETDAIYEVYLAPLTAGLDPALSRLDPKDSTHVVATDDDGGWQVGALLDTIVGTGAEEHFVALRSENAAGLASLLVRRTTAARLEPRQKAHLELTPNGSEWRSLDLPAGKWTIETSDLAEGVDTALEVLDARTGLSLAENDDLGPGTLASRVKIDAKGAGLRVLVHVRNLGAGGTASLIARPTSARVGTSLRPPHSLLPGMVTS